MIKENTQSPWYIAGLHFECLGCGRCCSGPQEGYIWITEPEIEMLAGNLGLTTEQVRGEYLLRFGLRTSIKEEPNTKDCIFLSKKDGQGRCCIYPVRPNQCRTWPFWKENLTAPDNWNLAATKCPGINRGKWYGFEDIERLRKQKQWRQDLRHEHIIKAVAELYKWLDRQTGNNRSCSACGKCCDFETYDHRLFVSSPEILYFTHFAGPDLTPMTTGLCPYNDNGRCAVYQHRFAACRIFCCKKDGIEQEKLSEDALVKIKQICTRFNLPYRYVDLKSALKDLIC